MNNGCSASQRQLFAVSPFTVNLSNIVLNNAEISLLDKGLTFIPTMSRIPIDRISSCVYRNVRGLQLRTFFKTKILSMILTISKTVSVNVVHGYLPPYKLTPQTTLRSIKFIILPRTFTVQVAHRITSPSSALLYVSIILNITSPQRRHGPLRTLRIILIWSLKGPTKGVQL